MTSAALCQLKAANPLPKTDYISSNITEQCELKIFTERVGYLPSGHLTVKSKIIHVSLVDNWPQLHCINI